MKAWSVSWQTPDMNAPAFWYFSSVRRAAEAVALFVKRGYRVGAWPVRINRRYRHVLNVPAVFGKITMSDLRS